MVVAAAALALGGCHRTKDMDGNVVSVAGSYAKTCRHVVAQGGNLTADCLDAIGQVRTSTIPADACPGKVNNINGILTCPPKA